MASLFLLNQRFRSIQLELEALNLHVTRPNLLADVRYVQHVELYSSKPYIYLSTGNVSGG